MLAVLRINKITSVTIITMNNSGTFTLQTGADGSIMEFKSYAYISILPNSNACKGVYTQINT